MLSRRVTEVVAEIDNVAAAVAGVRRAYGTAGLLGCRTGVSDAEIDAWRTFTDELALARIEFEAAMASLPVSQPQGNDCMSEFLDTDSAYGWEVCLYAQRRPWLTVTAADAEQIVSEVWEFVGYTARTPVPTLDLQASRCDLGKGCATVTTEGERIIGLPPDPLGGYALRLLLHELAHLIDGEGHDMTHRCWTLLLHVKYEIPEAVVAESEPIRQHCHAHLTG